MRKGKSREEAEAAAMLYSEIAGTSEHQTGLCVDILQGNYGLTKDFENSSAYRWLSENAYKFGFILSYPSGKESVTGFQYEPWHFRFVGREVSSAIYTSKITLGEYHELI